jgi:hypothetical protein
MVKLEGSESKPLPRKLEDLNGINPLIPLLGSAVPFAMAYAGYQLSVYLTANFAVGFLSSDIYPVQRAAIVARNIMVGFSTLATAFSGVIGVGLLALGVVVAAGVMRGELDPNKKPVGVDRTD